jgi:RNA 2',3'-cyclic 3'-phosphodiesterase
MLFRASLYTKTMKNSIRLFIAATLPDSLKEVFQEQLKQFQYPSLRFLPAQNLHLTLYFIGNISPGYLPQIKETIKNISRQYQPFILNYEQTEAGPNPKKPRLIWARFKPNSLFEQLSNEFSDLLSTEPVNTKTAIPHITLARFRKDKPISHDIKIVTSSEQLTLHVETISLWESILSTPHPEYSVLETYPLG